MEKRLRSSWVLPAIFCLGFTLPSSLQAITIHIPLDAPTIQAGIDSAADGDTVLVAPGTYTGDGNRDISFQGKAIVVMSDGGPAETIIDCEGSALMSARAFSFNNNETAASVLDGFTMIQGYAGYGGAIYCWESAPTIRNCVFWENTGWDEGGAIACIYDASPTIHGCTFCRNRSYGSGGGLYVSHSTATLSNTIIAFSSYGAGIHCQNVGSASLSCCDLYGNAGGDWVGLIADQEGLNGNFSEDPQFCDVWAGALHLDPGSPCVNAAGCGLVGALEVGCVPLPHRVWYVKADGTGDTPTIQSAIDSASAGDTVLVAPGTYTGVGNRQMTLHGKSIHVIGEDGPSGVIIDCEGSSTNVVRAFRIENRESPYSVLEGLTIREGYGRFGGAVYLSGASPTIRRCVFWKNIAWESGGAIFCRAGSCPLISSCSFSNNGALVAGGVFYTEGGSGPVVESSILAFSSWGEAVACAGGEISLSCCDVYGNAAGDWVGCIVDQYGTNGNFSEDPLFCGAAWGDFHVHPGSPCEDAPGCGLIGALETGCDPAPEARTWYVLPDGSGDAPTIQAAIDSAYEGVDTVLVATGTYTGSGNRDIEFRGKAVAVLSESGPGVTIIDIQGSSSGEHRGFRFADMEIHTSILDGFTITGGYIDSGGGIYCLRSSPAIRNCVICGNVAWGNGGGIFCRDGSSPAFAECTIAANRAGYEDGGGVYALNESFPVLERSIIAFSVLSDGVACGGESAVTLTCCDVYGNQGGDWIGCIADQDSVAGNLHAEPAFCDRFTGDYHLQTGSPCANALGCGRIGALDIGCDPPVPRAWYVLPDGSGDAPTLQAAIDSAFSGADTVLAGPGIYTGDGNRDLSLKGKEILVVSECGPESTMIDCQASVGEEHGGFHFQDGETDRSIVDGFTITGGRARWGGGIHCRHASPAILRCVVRNNTAWENGGGVACRENAHPLLEECVISGNTAGQESGGLYCEASSPSVVNCTIVANSGSPGGAVACGAGSDPTLENCILAFSSAGAALSCDDSSPTVICCDLFGNAGGDEICGSDGGGNIALHPLFCNMAVGDLRLCPESPCLPENNGCNVLIGACGAGDCPCPECRVVCVPDDYPTIGEALAAASYCDTVVVDPGTYVENLTVPWGVVLKSRTGSDLTVIDGNAEGPTLSIGLASKGSAQGVTRTLVEGFTITGGTDAGIRIRGCDPTIRQCVLTGNSRSAGGGMYCEESGAIIEGCTFVANFSTVGGGLYCTRSPLTITGCSFFNNEAVSGGGLACNGEPAPAVTNTTFGGNIASSCGGGLHCVRSSPVLTGVDVQGNTAEERGGGLYCFTEAFPTLVDCHFFDNTVSGDHVPYGGGVACANQCSLSFDACSFAGNSASWGGGIWCDNGSDCALLHCTFYDNWAWYGGGICLQVNSSSTLDNTIVAYGASGAAVFCDENSTATLTCCDIYGNAYGDWVGCIADQYGVRCNFRQDPLFCDAENGDLTLSEDSPCAAANSPGDCGLIGAFDVGCGFTRVTENEIHLPTQLHLASNVPNPFNPVTEISYSIPVGFAPSRVELNIYNALGQIVRTLVDVDRPAGFYHAVWDGRGEGGAPVASGVYFYRLSWNGKNLTRRMVLLK